MKHKKADQTGWQEAGGAIDIPSGWFVHGANFDCEEPYIEICAMESTSETRRLSFPKPLAYYLTTHFCGSEYMHEMIDGDGRRKVQNAIKQALGI